MPEKQTNSDSDDVWTRKGSLYDGILHLFSSLAIEPFKQRERDVRAYPNHTAYIHAGSIGTPDILLTSTAAMFSGIDKPATRVKSMVKVDTRARIFSNETTIVSVSAVADDTTAEARLEVLGRPVLVHTLVPNCVANTLTLDQGSVDLGKAGWSFPIKGFMVSVDVDATAVISLGVNYKICRGERVEASINVDGGVDLVVDGAGTVSVGFAGGDWEGGVRLTGGVGYFAGPNARQGEESRCVSLQYGNRDTDVSVRAYLERDDDGWEWDKVIEEVEFPGKVWNTSCLESGSNIPI